MNCQGWCLRCRPTIMEFRSGDHCAIEPYMSCGKCRACAMGRNNCCENIRLLGIHVDGGMQEYLAVPIELLHRSDRLSLDQLALVETLGIGAHAVKRSGLKSGEEAIVVGTGPIGIAVAQFASALGANVHTVEKSKWRREFMETYWIHIIRIRGRATGRRCLRRYRECGCDGQ